jgi:hypothetical protein
MINRNDERDLIGERWTRTEQHDVLHESCPPSIECTAQTYPHGISRVLSHNCYTTTRSERF